MPRYNSNAIGTLHTEIRISTEPLERDAMNGSIATGVINIRRETLKRNIVQRLMNNCATEGHRNETGQRRSSRKNYLRFAQSSRVNRRETGRALEGLLADQIKWRKIIVNAVPFITTPSASLCIIFPAINASAKACFHTIAAQSKNLKSLATAPFALTRYKFSKQAIIRPSIYPIDLTKDILRSPQLHSAIRPLLPANLVPNRCRAPLLALTPRSDFHSRNPVH